MNRTLFRQRVHANALSLWELGDLLGIHPHHLHTQDTAGGLPNQPVRVLIDLARRLDMHPADLIDDFDTVLANHRTPPAADAGDHDADALTVLNALATTSVPLTAEDLATALGWTLDRVTTTIGHATRRPELSGPVALRRVPPASWTITARHDLLSHQQRTALTDTAGYRTAITVDEANALLAAYAFGHTPDYNTWRQDHLDDEHTLKTHGLLQSDSGPHHAEPTPDVRYSLSRDPAPAGGGTATDK